MRCSFVNLIVLEFIALGLFMTGIQPEFLSANNLSHSVRNAAKDTLIANIQKRGDLPHISVKRQLEIVDDLSSFELGQFLIEHGGLNGYWTHYIISHPTKVQTKPLHELEAFLLNAAPTCLATQQRFVLFKEQIQKRISENCVFASVPSGMMGDLLDLDYSHVPNFALYAIDLDAEALEHAKNYAQVNGLSDHCHLVQSDAWNLNKQEAFDLISSNGLAIYEPDNQKVIALYRQFFTALKPGGVLVTSFLTPPPAANNTEWKLEAVNMQDALLQKILFVDILEAKWQVFRTQEQVKKQLQEAGFTDIEIHYDKAHIFPTVVAKKCQ